MPPGEQPEQHALDHVALSDDDLVDLGEHIVDEAALLTDQVVDDPDVLH